MLGVRPDFIEHQLAHAVRDPNGRAYNRTAHLPERRKMMQHWADYLDALKSVPRLLRLTGRREGWLRVIASTCGPKKAACAKYMK